MGPKVEDAKERGWRRKERGGVRLWSPPRLGLGPCAFLPTAPCPSTHSPCGSVSPRPSPHGPPRCPAGAHLAGGPAARRGPAAAAGSASPSPIEDKAVAGGGAAAGARTLRIWLYNPGRHGSQWEPRRGAGLPQDADAA